jgi:hypothetical protein
MTPRGVRDLVPRIALTMVEATVETRNQPGLPKGRRRRVTMYPARTPGGVELARWSSADSPRSAPKISCSLRPWGASFDAATGAATSGTAPPKMLADGAACRGGDELLGRRVHDLEAVLGVENSPPIES